MFISAIHKFRTSGCQIVPTIFYGREDHHPMREPVIAPPRHNSVAVSGGLALAFLGTTAVTGIARARIPHIVSSILALGASLFHVQSLTVRNNRNLNYSA